MVWLHISVVWQLKRLRTKETEISAAWLQKDFTSLHAGYILHSCGERRMSATHKMTQIHIISINSLTHQQFMNYIIEQSADTTSDVTPICFSKRSEQLERFVTNRPLHTDNWNHFMTIVLHRYTVNCRDFWRLRHCSNYQHINESRLYTHHK